MIIDAHFNMSRNFFNSLQFYSCFSILTFFGYFITHLLLQSQQISATPTIKCYDKFNLEKDIDTIHQIVRKEPRFVPDVDKMVRMVCHRCREQRMQMKNAFRDKYKTEISQYCMTSATGEISFGDLIDDCFRSTLGIYKHHLKRELTSPFKRLDKEAIVEILLSIPPERKQEFLNKYNETFKATVLDHVNTFLHEDFHNIIVEMVNRTRLPDIPADKINWDLAKKEAQLVLDERKKWKNHRCELDRVLMETPIQQLNATLTEFKNISGKEIEEVLDKHMERGKRGSYKSMVYFARNKHDYYAKRLHKAMKGVGTTDHTINRIVAAHSEDDLHEIATAFRLNTADTLIDALAGDTTIHHEMLITCLAGKPTIKENF